MSLSLKFLRKPVRNTPSPCFGPGTMLSTREGEIPVEWIAPGDEVLTRDNGFQPIRWVGRFPVSSLHMEMREELGAFTVERGAFGEGCPDHPLILSRHHRILIGGSAVQLHFGAGEAICPVAGLAEEGRIARQDAREITYTHVLCDRHEIILANSLWVETLFADAQSFFGPARPPADVTHAEAARLCLTESEGQMLARLGAVEQPQAQVSRVA